MYPLITPNEIRKLLTRPVGTFVVTTETDKKDRDHFWIEKVTQITDTGAEVLTKWCEAVSERKAYLITVALNGMTNVVTDG